MDNYFIHTSYLSFYPLLFCRSFCCGCCYIIYSTNIHNGWNLLRNIIDCKLESKCCYPLRNKRFLLKRLSIIVLRYFSFCFVLLMDLLRTEWYYIQFNLLHTSRNILRQVDNFLGRNSISLLR